MLKYILYLLKPLKYLWYLFVSLISIFLIQLPIIIWDYRLIKKVYSYRCSIVQKPKGGYDYLKSFFSYDVHREIVEDTLDSMLFWNVHE